jgi:DNA-binding NarL/FixJ family response regulator
MRVLLATGVEALDKDLVEGLFCRDIDVVGECYYREGLLSMVQQKKAGVVILSPHLPGQDNMAVLVKELRMYNIRIVLLPGDKKDSDALDLACKAAALGVYDILWDPVEPGRVAKRTLRPATLAEAGVEPNMEVIAGIRTGEEKEPREPEPQKPAPRKLKIQTPFPRKTNHSFPAADKARIPDSPVVVFTDNKGEEIYRHISTAKEKIVIIDCSDDSGLPSLLDIDRKLAWECDWRLGMVAKPHVYNKRVCYYGIIGQEPSVIDERDLRALDDIMKSLDSKTQVLFNDVPEKVFKIIKQYTKTI